MSTSMTLRIDGKEIPLGGLPLSEIKAPLLLEKMPTGSEAVIRQLQQALPERIINELLAIADQLTNISWRIGDLDNQLCQMVLAMELRKLDGSSFAFQDIHLFLGALIGKSARTVRSWAAVAAFYPVPIRQKFEALPFEHFKFAMSVPGLDPGSILYLSLTRMDLNGGFPPSIDWLEIHVQSLVNGAPPAPPENLPDPEWAGEAQNVLLEDSDPVAEQFRIECLNNRRLKICGQLREYVGGMEYAREVLALPEDLNEHFDAVRQSLIQLLNRLDDWVKSEG